MEKQELVTILKNHLTDEQTVDRIYTFVTNVTPQTASEERMLGEIYSIIQESRA